jgi:hypothetical protein
VASTGWREWNRHCIAGVVLLKIVDNAIHFHPDHRPYLTNYHSAGISLVSEREDGAQFSSVTIRGNLVEHSLGPGILLYTKKTAGNIAITKNSISILAKIRISTNIGAVG